MVAQDRTFEILGFEDIIPKDRMRRLVKVWVEITSEGNTELVELGYPAYGNDHYSASIDFYDKLKGKLNHAIATAVSREVKRLWHDFPGSEDL